MRCQGMGTNPFGRQWVPERVVGDELRAAHWESNRRLDKTDELLREIMNGNTPPEFAIYAAPLLKSIHNYKYWFLGDNKVTDTKWWDAYDYLFRIRSNDPSTWCTRKLTYTEDLPDGKRIRVRSVRTDEDMRLLCFDVHYHLIRLDRVMPMSSFLRLLREDRRRVLQTNLEQAEAYRDYERSLEFCRTFPGAHIPLSYHDHDFVETLTEPVSIRQLEELVMFPAPDPNYRPPKKDRGYRPPPSRRMSHKVVAESRGLF